jgi:Bacterial mobilisation protein (MobC)
VRRLDAALPGALMPGKRKSEKRQRRRVIPVRVTPEEFAALTVKADAATGGKVSTWLRLAGLEKPLPPQRSDRQEITRLSYALGQIGPELGKIGSNINQLAHYANMDRVLAASIASALAEHEQACRTIEELRLAALQALGFERERKPGDEDDED